MIPVYSHACLLTYENREYIATSSPSQEYFLKFWYLILDQKVFFFIRFGNNFIKKLILQISTIVMFPAMKNNCKINYLPEPENNWMDIELGIRIKKVETTVHWDFIQR